MLWIYQSTGKERIAKTIIHMYLHSFSFFKTYIQPIPVTSLCFCWLVNQVLATAGAVRAATSARFGTVARWSSATPKVRGSWQIWGRCRVEQGEFTGKTWKKRWWISPRMDWTDFTCKRWGIGELKSPNGAWRYEKYDATGISGMAYWNVKEEENSKIRVCSCKREFQPLSLCIFSGILALKTRWNRHFPKKPRKNLKYRGLSSLWPLQSFLLMTCSEYFRLYTCGFCSENSRVATEHLVNVVNVAVSTGVEPKGNDCGLCHWCVNYSSMCIRLLDLSLEDRGLTRL